MFGRTSDDSVAGASRHERPTRTPGRSVLGPDLHLSGIVATAGVLEVHGRVEGEVTAGALVVGPAGTVSGRIQANEAEVIGQLRGEIGCSSLTVRDGGRLAAEVVAEVLVVENGAQVQGRFARPAPAKAD